MNPLALVLPTNSTKETPSGDPYLRVQLDRQSTAILSMRYLQEVLVVPVQRLTPMPNVPACMLGLINRRSRVLWVIDLAHLLHMQSSAMHSQQYKIVVVQVGTMSMGLVVQNVEGIVRIGSDRIQSPVGAVSEGLVPFLRGCVLHDQEIWMLIDIPAIAHSPMLRSY